MNRNQKINYELIPPHMLNLIREYLENGEYMGNFLTSVFANDLKNALGLADNDNIKLLNVYVSFVVWKVPAECQGSYEKVNQWMEKKQNEQLRKNSGKPNL